MEFATLLTQILSLLGIPQEKQPEAVKAYDQLCIKRFCTFLLDQRQNDTNIQYLRMLLAQINEQKGPIANEAVEKLIGYFLKTIPEEERTKAYLNAKIQVLIEVIAPLLETATDVEKEKVTAVIKKHPEISAVLLGR